ncbi:MAG: RagB/SusD family nutrient uptake outer membrane protein, partial [Muribaculaceae bacterium]|nr:RagB/SusD family nutrient uptake outer membrane protein [Muribaculaceae bacterium]
VAYNSLHSFDQVINMHDQASDLYMEKEPTKGGDFNTFELNSENGDVKNYYTNGYKGINNANCYLFYAGEGTKEADEMIFLRSYFYYLLTQQFGAVPYVKEYINTAERVYPRVPLDEIYPDLIADLTEVYNAGRLPATDHTGRASKQAVAALLAKITLAAAWDLDVDMTDSKTGAYNVKSTARFKEAAAWAEKAINGVQLTMSFDQKWAFNNQENNEEIFSVHYDRNSVPTDVLTSGHSLQNHYTCYFGNNVAVGLKGMSSGGDNLLSVKKGWQLFEKGDERFAGTFMTTYYNSEVKDGTAAWGDQGYMAFYNCDAAKLAGMPIAYQVFPYYMTEAECEAWLTAHKNQTVKLAGYGTQTPKAVRLHPDGVTVWSFNADGSFSKSSQDPYTFSNVGGGYNGISVRKWDDPQSGQVQRDNDYRNIVLFHVSDMYLTAAEAYLLAGDEGQALAKVNAVRDRAKAPHLNSFGAYDPDYGRNLALRPLDLILDEYGRECYAEMRRFHELRRTKQLVRYNLEFSDALIAGYQSICGIGGAEKWYRPIPSDEFNQNMGLDLATDQNPGF